MKDVKSWVQESHSLSKMITKYIHIQTSSFQMLKSKIKSLRQPEPGVGRGHNNTYRRTKRRVIVNLSSGIMQIRS